MARQTDKAKQVHQLFLRLNGQTRQRWETVNQEGHNFYLDNQLTAIEEKALQEQGMPTFTINRIIPIVEMLTFYATANEPKWQAVGVEGSDSDAAAVHAEVADYIWYISNGKNVMSQIVQDACTKSVGYFQVYVDPNADRGMGEVKLRTLEPFDVYVDPQSRDPLYTDAAYMMVHKILPRAQLEMLYPDKRTKIKNAASQYPTHQPLVGKSDMHDFQYKDVSEGFSMLGEDELLIDYYELYEKLSVPYMNVFYRVEPSPEEIQQIEQGVMMQLEQIKKETDVEVEETMTKMAEQVKSGDMIESRFHRELEKLEQATEAGYQSKQEELMQEAMEAATDEKQAVITEKEFKIQMKGSLKENIIQATKFYDTRIKLSIVIGDQYIQDSILPGYDYPIVPINYKYTGTPYPMSAVAPLIGKQKELNKAHQLMVHNASLGSSLRWMYVDGSIDVDHWEQYSAAPGALLPVNSGYEAPTAVLPAQLSSAFVNIVDQGKGDMEYLAGIYSAMQGDTGTQHETYKGLLANDEYGTRRVKAWMEGGVKNGLTRLGQVVKDYAQAIYKAHKVLRLVQPSAIQEQRQVELNVPIYNDMGQAIGKWNDYSTSQFDVRVIAGQSLPINRWAYLGELKELLQLNVIDDIAVLAETDVKNKEGIAKRKSLYAEQQGQITNLEEALQDKEGTIETLERQMIQLGIKDKVRQAEHDMRKKVVDTSAKIKGDAAVNKANQDRYNYEMSVEKQKYKEELQKDLQNKSLQTNGEKK